MLLQPFVINQPIFDVKFKKKHFSYQFLALWPFLAPCLTFLTRNSNKKKPVPPLTFEGVAKDFVSIQIVYDFGAKTLELKQEDYWEKAVERFKEFLGEKGPKERLVVPLSPADEKLLDWWNQLMKKSLQLNTCHMLACLELSSIQPAIRS